MHVERTKGRSSAQFRRYLCPVSPHQATRRAGIDRAAGGVETGAVMGVVGGLWDAWVGFEAEFGEVAEAVAVGVANGVGGFAPVETMFVLPVVRHAVAVGVIVQAGG